MPRQTRARMVVKSFRISEDAWARFVARCEREGANPTEVVRDLASEWASTDPDD